MTRTPAERRLEELAAAHGPRVLAYLARRTTPAEDAADVLQEVLTTAWRRISDAPDDPDHALAWLLAIARRTLANHRRGQARRHDATARLRAELAGGRTPLPADDPAVDGVREALGSLAADDREVLALAYWDGLTGEQVAVVLAVSPASARKRLQRARERLRRVLDADPVASPERRVPDGSGEGGPEGSGAAVRHGSQRGERALTGQ
ncbi:sigma-70 family RNA polymerase sigma factor [Phycicoccus sp. M110.8]|uniref:RNA polymerase sigma factor n=1 Tax=Phycicoccus sp. M110.8 TaxID=3075433 RepID=UPI0028FD3EB9|nr:sigma-70 family RNA polymerase sigma factor [Phycicoccus sp. M110.8]MDU0313876.1 sigma-70 family RNA polymerase sigma factor [Phycicoccus sp. M110.8]